MQTGNWPEYPASCGKSRPNSGTTATQKEQAETALQSLNTEFEQLKINFGTEKNRAQESDRSLTHYCRQKTQSEQDLTGIINDMKDYCKRAGCGIHKSQGGIGSRDFPAQSGTGSGNHPAERGTGNGD